MEKVDLDQDGDMDMVSGGLRALSWEENIGNGAFVNRVITQAQPEIQAVYPVDLDQDGYMDVLSASFSNNVIYWNRNNGVQSFTSVAIASGSALGSPVALDAADFDGDGDIDVVSAGFNGDLVYWLRNDGNQNFTKIDLISGFNSPIKVRAGDMDGDGDMDIVAAAREGDELRWLSNNGNGTFVNNFLVTLNNFHDIKLRDFDNDGDLDILYASDGGWGRFTNNGGTFTQVSQTTGSGVRTVDIGDVNNDGINDWIIAGYSSELITFATVNPDGTMGFGEIIDTMTRYPNLLAIHDFDGDGYVDVMSAGSLDMRYLKNSPTFEFERIPLNIYAGNVHGLCHGDFDNDGDVDLMCTGFSFMYWYRNEGNGEYTPIRLTQNFFQWIDPDDGVYIRAADMDGDGDDDAIYSENDGGRVSWIENLGGGNFVRHTAFSISGSYSVEPVDFDGDGDMDVVTTSTANDAVYWHENNGSQVFTQHLVSAEYWDPFHTRTLDLDNDGDMDILCTQGTPSNKLVWYRNSGNDLDFNDIQIDSNSPGINCVYTIDIDQDGDVDLLTASETDDRINLYTNNGAAYPQFTKSALMYNIYGATYVFADDFDDDGDYDVVCTSWGEKKCDFLENDGNQNFSRVTLANIGNPHAIEGGDIDADGVPEIYVVGAEHGIVEIFNSVPFQTPPPVSLAPCADLFISEYVEGSSYNKALEIYNPTGVPVDLAPYRLLIYANGSTNATQTIYPSGTLQPNDVWVIAHSLSDLEFWFAADIDGTLNFNGNDAIVLTKNGNIIDIIGVIGQDPGTGWAGSDGSTTVDRTLVRKPGIAKGNNIVTGTFDASVEWEVYPIDAWQYIGNHTGACADACVPTIQISASSTSVCGSESITFTATLTNEGDAPVIQWKKNGSDVGTNSPTYIASGLINGDVISCTVQSNADCALEGTFTSNNISVTVAQPVTPTATISTEQTTICAGSSVTFTASGTGLGSTPVYQWKKNGDNVGTNNSSYTASGLVNGDIITCVITSAVACVTSATATSNAVTMTVVQSLTPTIAITSGTPSPICANTSVTFTATATNQGNAPAFQWKRNGINVGTNQSTYTNSSWTNGDIITCVLTSNASCLSSTTATSNAITLTVTPSVTPSVSISATQTNVCSNGSITFTATVTNGGPTPTYQWKRNGSNVGTNSATYTNGAWVNGDVITCSVTGSATCGNSTVNSNSVTITVTTPVTPTVNILASSTNVCAGTLVIFNAFPSNGGTNPSYVWRKNGDIVSTNGNAYSETGLQNGDVIMVTMTSSLGCVTQASANSTQIVMTVSPTVTPTISIAANNNNVCSGTAVTFTASVTHPGSIPGYQWKRNGFNVGTNSSTYMATNLSNGDVITCVLTSNANCASPASVTSNGITMNITPSVTPQVSISASQTQICAGTSVTFTATPVNGGGSPGYQWKRNGFNVGTNSPVFTSTTLQNNDQITCVLTSSAACVTGPATGNTIVIQVSDQVTPSVSLTANATEICTGETVIFNAIPVNGGTQPDILWYVNDVLQVASGSSFAAADLQDGDEIHCLMSSSATCVTTPNATSNTIQVTVSGTLTPQITITNQNESVCFGSPTTFAAGYSGAGSSPVFTWYLNDAVVGTNSDVYTASWLNNGDQIYCEISGAQSCVGTAVSNMIEVVVVLIPTPVLSLNNEILEVEAVEGAEVVWWLNGEVLENANGTSFLPEEEGLYSVNIVVAGCESQMSNTVSITFISVTEKDASEILVYPNPANQMVRIEAVDDLREVVFIDQMGRDVLRTNQKVTDISTLASGSYTVRIRTDKHTVQRKLIVQH